MVYKQSKSIASVLMKRLLCAMLIINSITIFLVSNYVENTVFKLENDHLAEIISNVSNSVTITLDKYIELTKILSESTAIKNLMLASDKENPMSSQENTHEVVSELLRISEQFEGIVTNFGLLDIEQDGYLTHHGISSPDNFSFKERPYYNDIINKQTVLTSPYYDHLTNTMVLSVVSPVLLDDEVLGAVLIDLTISFLSDMVILSNHGKTGSSVILDIDNNILAYKDMNSIGSSLDSLDIVSDNMSSELESPTGTIFSYTINNSSKIGLVGEINHFNWKVLTYLDLDEFKEYSTEIHTVLSLLLIFSAIVLLILIFLNVKYSLKPVSYIKEAMQELADGNVDFSLNYRSDNEIGNLADHVRVASQNLKNNIDLMQYQLDYDTLTGLYSERKFIEITRNIIKENPEIEYSFVSIDIDNFKYINETYSYFAGSSLLKEIGKMFLTEYFINSVVCRNNSDRFTLFIETNHLSSLNITTGTSFYRFNQKACEVLGGHYDLSMSVGIYNVTHSDKDVTWMMDCATYARGRAKTAIGLSIEYYDESMNQTRVNSNYITSKMQEGIANCEFVVFYQPKVDLNTNEIVGAEALVRWFSDNIMIPPNDFIPVFEQNGFIETLDYYIIDSVCKLISKESHRNLPTISINLSGVTIMKKDVVSRVCQIVKSNNISASQVELEITESAFVEHFEIANARIDEFRALGFRISMDDFGSGISSLGRLKNMSIDVLKIDREFIIETFVNEKAGKIIRHIVEMSKDLGVKTVVEGIETPEQLDFLTQVGCDIGQGYIFARALPCEEFLSKLDTHISNI